MVVRRNNRVGIIRVLTTDDKSLLHRHGRILEGAFPALVFDSRCIPDQPEGIHDAETERMASPKVAALAREMVCEGVGGILVSCAGDPAVRELQRELPVPVVGAGIATAHLACTFGAPVGVLGITEDVPEEMRMILGSLLVAAVRPDAVTSTLDLMTPAGREQAVAAAGRMKAQGVRVLALACTGFATIGIAQVLREETGLVVIDPLIAAGAAMWSALC